MSKKGVQDRSVGKELLKKAKAAKAEQDSAVDSGIIENKRSVDLKKITDEDLFMFFGRARVFGLLENLYNDAIDPDNTASERTAAKREIFDRILGKPKRVSNQSVQNFFNNVEFNFTAMKDGKEEE